MKNRIKKIRDEFSLSQRDFAKKIDIGASTLSLFETGYRTPKDIHIKRICSEFGINEEWLRTGTGEMFKDLPEDEVAAYVSELLFDNGDNPLYGIIKDIMKTYSQLDSNSKEVLKNFSKSLLDNLEKKED